MNEIATALLEGEYHIDFVQPANPFRWEYHQHSYWEMGLVTQGSVSYQVENMTYTLNPGYAIIIPAESMHCPVVNYEVGSTMFILRMDAAYLYRLWNKDENLKRSLMDLAQKKAYVIEYTQEDFAFGSSLLSRAFACSTNSTAYSDAIMTTFVYHFASQLGNLRNVGVHIGFNPIDSVIEFLQSHFSENITLDYLCTKYKVSKSHLNRLFKATTGITLYDYILSKRVGMAREEIRKGTNAREAATLCGFSDYSSFYKSFTAKTNCTPAQFKSHWLDGGVASK